jgi:hypothetical protein
MTTTLPSPRRSTARPRSARRAGASQLESARGGVCRAGTAAVDCAGELLASYLDGIGRFRDLVSCEGVGGSRLVIDCDRTIRSDRRLVAHLAADEPHANAKIVCDLYLRDARCRRCRRVTAEDMRSSMPNELDGQCSMVRAASVAGEQEHCDAAGNRYGLCAVPARISMPELRWCKSNMPSGADCVPVSVRDVIGAIESYEPIRASSADAICRYRAGRAISVSALGVELERLNASRIVLNRGLREAVLAAVERDDLSMSEIALRCGRVKRDRRGGLSGETTWLARRLGLVRDGGAHAPSPWVHTDVLALIARRGLCVAPREVEIA